MAIELNHTVVPRQDSVGKVARIFGLPCGRMRSPISDKPSHNRFYYRTR